MNITLNEFGMFFAFASIVVVALLFIWAVIVTATMSSDRKQVKTETAAFKDPDSVHEDALNLFAENELYELTTPFSRHISVLECNECGTIGSPRMVDLNGPCPVCGIYETSHDENDKVNQSFDVIVAKPVKDLERGFAFWERV